MYAVPEVGGIRPVNQRKLNQLEAFEWKPISSNKQSLKAKEIMQNPKNSNKTATTSQHHCVCLSISNDAPVRMDIVVVFPAPLWPKNEVI